ncbi:MAG: hypothetical protein DLM60_10025 [Pseudonocardiales bacterium]|nr:MAG: hypothetical protein DLM60_10025 [Pseudonocardiales bacterium]
MVELLVGSRCPALSPWIVLPRSEESTSFVLAALRALHVDSSHAVQVRLGIEATVRCSGSDQVRHCWSPAVGDG